MISRLNNNNSFYRPVDELSPAQESAKSAQAESVKADLITETGFPKFAATGNSSVSPESTSIAAEVKADMNMRAGLLQKSLNDALSIKEPSKAEFPNLLKPEETKR